MDLKSTNELLSAQELELLNDFQMEELEERMEMDSWFRNEATATVGVSAGGDGASGNFTVTF
jgi:hypothetical protein